MRLDENAIFRLGLDNLCFDQSSEDSDIAHYRLRRIPSPASRETQSSPPLKDHISPRVFRADASSEYEKEQSGSIRLLRNEEERSNSQLVENSPRMVNQLTKVSEILPSVVDQLATQANQEKLDNQSPVVNQNEEIHSGPDRFAKNESHFKSRKERKLKGIRISAEKLHKYELWCFVNKIDFQDAVEKALDWLTSGQPVNHVLIDDLDEDDKNNKLPSSSAVENIAAFYREWTRNTVSEEDLKAIREISSLDPNTIKLGIMTAIYRKASSKGTRKINSFRYFFGTIREVANSKMGGSVTLQRLEQVISLLLKTRDNHQPIDGRSE
jgi:hypothetical protein